MAQPGPDWPDLTLRGQEVYQSAPNRFSGGIQVNWRQLGALQGQSGPVKNTLSQYEYNLVYFETPFHFANISAP